MDWLILRDVLNTACNIMNATIKEVGRVEGEGRCPQMQATKLCAQWARQMATAAQTIP